MIINQSSFSTIVSEWIMAKQEGCKVWDLKLLTKVFVGAVAHIFSIVIKCSSNRNFSTRSVSFTHNYKVYRIVIEISISTYSFIELE